MVDITQASQQLAARAGQAQEEERRIAAIETRERPSTAELLKRSQMGLPAMFKAREAEVAAQSQKEQQMQAAKEESQFIKSQQEALAPAIKALESYKQEKADIENALWQYKMGSSDPYSIWKLENYRQKEIYRQLSEGKVQDVLAQQKALETKYAGANIEYKPSENIFTITQTSKELSISPSEKPYVTEYTYRPENQYAIKEKGTMFNAPTIIEKGIIVKGVQIPDVQYKGDVARYQAAGYSTKEARALAEYSDITQTTPTPQLAERYLRSQGIAPSRIREKPAYYTNVLLSKTSEVLAKPHPAFLRDALNQAPIAQKGTPTIQEIGIFDQLALSTKIPTTTSIVTAASNIQNERSKLSMFFGKTREYLKAFDRPQWQRNLATPETQLAVTKAAVTVGAYATPLGWPMLVFETASFESRTERLGGWEYIKQNKLEAGTLAVVWTTVGVSKLLKPEITPLAAKEPKIKSVDVIQPYIQRGVQVEAGKFRMKVDIPAREAEKTNLFKRIFGIKPEIIQLAKPRTVDIYVLGAEPKGVPKALGAKGALNVPIYTKEGQIVSSSGFITKTAGRKVGTAWELSGGSKEISIADFKTASPIEKQLFRDIAKARTGTSVSDKFIPKVLGEEFKFSTIELQATRTGKAKLLSRSTTWTMYKEPLKMVSSKELAVAKEGLTMRKGLFKVTSIPKEGETQFYNYLLTTKNIKLDTAPFARASGKLTRIKGITAVRPAIDLTPAGADVEMIKSIGTVSLKSVLKTDTTQSMETLAQVKALALKTIPKTRVTIPKAQDVFAKPILAGTMSITALKGEQAVKTIQKEKPIQTVRMAQAEVLKQDTFNVPVDKTFMDEVLTLKQETPQDYTFKTAQEQGQQLRTAQTTQQVSKQSLITTTTPTTITTTKITMIPPIVLKTGFSSIKTKTASGYPKLKTAYEPQIKVRGKFISIGKPMPFGKAMEFGARRVTTSLSQRFRLLQKGTTSEADISYSLPARIFTVPKRKTSSIEFVERRGMTLKRGTGEIPLLQSARRSKKKRSFL